MLEPHQPFTYPIPTRNCQGGQPSPSTVSTNMSSHAKKKQDPRPGRSFAKSIRPIPLAAILSLLLVHRRPQHSRLSRGRHIITLGRLNRSFTVSPVRRRGHCSRNGAESSAVNRRARGSRAGWSRYNGDSAALKVPVHSRMDTSYRPSSGLRGARRHERRRIRLQ
jgi:hypothetical protein